jgi:hypothetical protein
LNRENPFGQVKGDIVRIREEKGRQLFISNGDK